MSKVDTILDGISGLLEKHLGGELRRNARSITASVGPEPARYVVRVRVKEKKARTKTVAAKAKRPAKAAKRKEPKIPKPKVGAAVADQKVADPATT